MASWTDGAAYAPLERPDGFATPEVEPLDVAVPDVAQTPGPIPPPAEFHPSAPAAPLSGLRTAPPVTRDPSSPFQVGAGLMTIASSMGPIEARDPRRPFQTHRDDALGVEALPPPTGTPLKAPAVAPFLSTQVGVPANGRDPRVSRKSAQQQSTQRTLVFLGIVCAVLGLIIPAVSAWMLVFAGLLTLRAKPLVGRAGAWSTGVGLTLMLFGGLVAPSAAAALGRLATLVFIGWFGIAASQRSRPQR